MHGPFGVLDLAVPNDTSVHAVAAEYSRQAGLSSIPLLYTKVGRALRPDSSISQAGIRSGDLVVAAAGVHREREGAPVPPSRRGSPARWWPTWFWVAAGLAIAAGWSATRAEPGPARTLALGLLGLAALIGVLPFGRGAQTRALVAPAFGGALAFAMAKPEGSVALPLAWGTAALAAAAVAAVARSWADGNDEALLVWMVGGASFFAIAAGAAVLGLGPSVVWSVALVVVMLAARWVPTLAVEVPDQTLIDLERLAVTAWSARERAPGRRGRTLVSPAMVDRVAVRAGRTVTAASAAIAVVAAVAATQLLATARADLDRQGARWLVFFASAALLLGARSYRHTWARAFLCLGGLAGFAGLGRTLLGELTVPGLVWWATAAIGLAVVLMVVAVASGRGWRSAWWSRRAEVAEALSGSAAVALVCLSTGLFRVLWENTAAMFRA